jgi:tetratricopeptide (TPR) repeat protein
MGPWAAAAVAFAAGDLDLADREIAKARARADNDARTHLLQAKVYLKRNLPEQAVESLAAALAANPLLVEANFLLAQLHGNRREWDKAERYAEAARTANPNHEAVRAYLRVVQEQRRTRDNPAAADEPARAAGLRPAPREYVQPSPLQQREGFDSLMKAATELVRRGELWEAVGKYRKAIELSPASCEAHVALGRTYYDLNQTPAAIETFNDAISANRRCASAYLGLASIQQDQGQKSLAVANYEQFLRLSPGGPDAAEVRSILDNLRRNP